MTNLILLVSDEDRVNCPLERALTKTAPEFRVELVENREGIEALRTPSVILLDLTEERSLDVLRWLRTDPRYKQVPVFVLAPRADVVSNAYALGANSCLLKQPVQKLEPIAQGIAAYASLIAESARANTASPMTV